MFTYQIVILSVLVFMTLIWLVAQLKKDNSIVDIFWGSGFILVALVSLFWNGYFSPRQIIVTGLVLVWGGRLVLHIGFRNWNKGEDFRYRAMRKRWGHWQTFRAFTDVFLLQGFFLFVISLPITMVNKSSDFSLYLTDFIGVIVWLTGFLFEFIADIQLKNFTSIQDNKGKLMTKGLWSWSRHPNYFGESLLWWGIALIAYGSHPGWPVLISPVVMTFLLLFVSGVPLLERKYAGRDDFEEYKKRTSRFFPLPPRKGI